MSKLRQSIIESSVTELSTDGTGALSKTFRFEEDFPGFQGHFPDMPIVPAIAQMLAAQSIIEEATQQSLRLKSVTRAKYMEKLGPSLDIVVNCQPRSGDGKHRYLVKVSTGGTKASSFRMEFE